MTELGTPGNEGQDIGWVLTSGLGRYFHALADHLASAPDAPLTDLGDLPGLTGQGDRPTAPAAS